MITVFTSNTHAQVTHVQGKITRIQIFNSNYGNYNTTGKGYIGFFMSELTPACGTGLKRVIISNDHPLFNTVLSAALTAKTTGKEIEFWHTGKCTLRSNSWDFALFQVLP